MTGAGWIPGSSADYDRESCVDLAQLSAFLRDTQPDTAEAFALDGDNITRQRFLARLKRQVTDRGVVEVLRNGIRHGQHNISLFYATPSAGNERAQELHALNRFSITRQLRYSGRNPSPGPRPRAVHKRPARGDLRAEEQPHQADRGGRRGAVQA